MNTDSILCVCGHTLLVTQSTLKDHLQTCTAYSTYSPIARLFRTLPLETLDTPQLMVLLSEMQGYQSIIQDIITSRQPDSFGVPSPSKIDAYFRAPHDLHPSLPPQDNLLQCQNKECGQYFPSGQVELIWYVYACFHLVCRRCLQHHICQQLPQQDNVRCPVEGCGAFLGGEEVVQVVGQECMQALQEQAMAKLVIGTVQCVSCGERVQVDEGDHQSGLHDADGQPLGETQLAHYRLNRFKCPSCLQEQCKECQTKPYHLGFTCQEYQKRCRFCGLKSQNGKCQSAECQLKMADACPMLLACGHQCGGYKGESVCLSCLECTHQADQLCSLCQVDTLSQAPSVQLRCGHYYHVHCLDQRVRLGRAGPRLTFGFCQCVVCREWVETDPVMPFYQLLAQHKTNYQRILDMTHKRMAIDKDMTLEQALQNYSYYQCFHCHQPFFGGLKACELEQQGDYRPEELVCPGCVPINPMSKCIRHGKDFIEFKCRYCCQVAQWFCGGTTHYCDMCHSGKRSQAIHCNGNVQKCPLKIKHPSPGNEFPLGCAICRNEGANHF